MPEKMGPELIRELKEFKPEVRCIFMTGGDTGEYTPLDLLQCGVECVLYKPFSIEALMQSLDAVS
jgi:DNA-binding NarL/FixJ family response regulator